jgi:GNAT superfamily N-acetyltransferase
MLALINLVQPSLPWTKEYLNWQFFATPAGPARLYGFQDANGDLVSLYAAIAQRVLDQDRVVPARMVQDVMTHPDYRGRGFLHLLAERCLSDMKQSGEIGYTFPNEKSANSFQRTGWKELCVVPARQKALSPVEAIEPPPDIDVSPVVGAFEDSIASIWQASGLGCGVERSTEFINWRYAKPATEYFKFQVNATDGFLVLKIYRTSTHQVLHICDLLVREDRRSLIPKILQFSECFASSKKASVLTAWLHEAHPYATYFDQLGLFLRVNPSRRVFVYDGKPRNSGLTDARRWHLTQGDSDVY